VNADTHRAVLVVNISSLPDVPSTTAIKAFARVAARLAELETGLARSLESSGLTQSIGTDNVLPATPGIFASLEQAVRRGEAWLRASDQSGQS
jgi:hypothetical protein